MLFILINLQLFIDEYMLQRYFPQENLRLKGLTSRYGKYRGTVLRIGLDCHEIRFHAKFANEENRNEHNYLRNWEPGMSEFNLIQHFFLH